MPRRFSMFAPAETAPIWRMVVRALGIAAALFVIVLALAALVTSLV